MDMLKKYKVKGIPGFCQFVRNLEQMPESKRNHILQLAMLEDPVYVQCVRDNIYDIEIFFKIGEIYFPDIYQALDCNLDWFIKAFHGTDKQDHFLGSIMHKKLKAEYAKLTEYMNEIEPNVRISAQKKIVEAIRTLQDQEAIREIKWEVPPERILKNLMAVPKQGPYKLLYPDGGPALEGQFEEKLREGPWNHYYPGRRLLAKGFYHQGEKVDEWVFFHPNELKASEGVYRNDLKEGAWTLWDQSGDQQVVHYYRGRPAK